MKLMQVVVLILSVIAPNISGNLSDICVKFPTQLEELDPFALIEEARSKINCLVDEVQTRIEYERKDVFDKLGILKKTVDDYIDIVYTNLDNYPQSDMKKELCVSFYRPFVDEVLINAKANISYSLHDIREFAEDLQIILDIVRNNLEEQITVYKTNYPQCTCTENVSAMNCCEYTTGEYFISSALAIYKNIKEKLRRVEPLYLEIKKTTVSRIDFIKNSTVQKINSIYALIIKCASII